jgi:serine/threonine protein kinase
MTSGSEKQSTQPGPGEGEESGFEAAVDRFDLAWRRGSPPRIADFLPPAAADARSRAERRALLAELIKVDLEYRWRPKPDPVRSSALDVEQVAAEDLAERLAARRRVDDYIREFPELRESTARGGVPLDLLAEEYLVRRRFGDRPAHAEFLTRYPAQATEVANMLADVDRQFVEAGDDSVEVRGDLGTLVDSVAIGKASQMYERSAADPRATIRDSDSHRGGSRGGDSRDSSARGSGSASQDRGHRTVRDDKMQTIGHAGADAARDEQFDDDRFDSRLGRDAAFITPAPDDRPAVARFVARLRESRVLAPAEGDEIAAQAEAVADPNDVKSFAALLVAAGRLTDYQADALLRGDGRRLVLGEYIVLSKIGEGGMGAVYKARHRRMDRVVALKVLSRSSTRSREALQRFLREARTAGRLSHPNIVLALDASEDSGRHYLVMEYVDGINVRQIVKRRGPLAPAEALSIARQVAEGLAAAHAAHIVHRDIKPDNILVNSAGVAKVLDLGLARLNEEAPREFITLTGTGSIVGTPEFMAPEQAADPRHADLRADVYGLGCTLYYMLSGKPPYEADGVFEKLVAHRDRPVPSVRAMRTDVTREVDRLIARMMAKEASERPQTMADVIESIDAAVADMQRRDARSQIQSSGELPTNLENGSAVADESYSNHRPPRRIREWVILGTLVACIAMLVVRLVLVTQ